MLGERVGVRAILGNDPCRVSGFRSRSTPRCGTLCCRPAWRRVPHPQGPERGWGSKAAGQRARALALVERFDIEPYSDFSFKWSNFMRLVLCCIKIKFCNKIFVGKLSPRSTQCTPLHRSLISKFSLKFSSAEKLLSVDYIWTVLYRDLPSSRAAKMDQ